MATRYYLGIGAAWLVHCLGLHCIDRGELVTGVNVGTSDVDEISHPVWLARLWFRPDTGRSHSRVV